MFHRLPSLLSLLAASLLALFLAGCGPTLVPFTHELRLQHNLSNDDIKNLQFYVSHTMTLRRELESGGSQVTASHKLLLVSGKTIEEVVIEEHTPGVAVDVKGNALAVSFEPGSAILFTAAPGPGIPSTSPATFASPPDPFPGNNPDPQPQPEPFPSPGPSAGGSYWLAVADGAKVNFQGRFFDAVEETLKAHLLIDAEALEEVVESRKVLPGVRLPSQ
jgi:hypothetical protein